MNRKAARHARPYIALIHKSPTSHGVSFPDLPGIITAADTLDEALRRAAAVLAFAFEDWTPPAPRGLDELRLDAEFVEWSEDAIVAVVRPENGFAGEGWLAPRSRLRCGAAVSAG